MAERVRIGRLHLVAPQAAGAEALARQTAEALRRELVGRGLQGRHEAVHVTVDPAEAQDPVAIARAVARALGEGGR